MKSRIVPFLEIFALSAILFALAGCAGLGGSSSGPTPTPTPVPASMNSLNHFILFMQENRSFDHYFGQLNAYRAKQTPPLPQDVDTWTSGTDKTPTNVSAPSFDPNNFPQPGPPIKAFHMQSACSENLTPSWNETHRIWNLFHTNSGVFTMDGFAYIEGKFAHDSFVNGQPNFTDFTGKRAMGFYDDSDLPFYYFMASNFATSDRWFSPAPTRTHPNRFYWMAATSQGFVVPPTQQITAKTIFELMDENHISWKIYTVDGHTYFSYFTYFNAHHANVVPLSQYFTDVQNGTLPQVAYIETGIEVNQASSSGVDEHPKSNIQLGAQFAAKLVNALMSSQSWKDSVMIETFDEGGGLYDHVPPIPVPSPDGIAPIMPPTNQPGDFTLTGFRVPLIVISPFSKKNFVSHTPMDYTAVLKMIETRFNMPNLTQRDASMPDMSEFFDFTTSTGPWATPPSPPTQPTSMPCTFGVPIG
ncbi:MAG TPA: alkaline phosphatase family protein [Candidatus Angelobacter sp.]|nr:alkaline phosphatase family protein [Candidatus Angelobacter sp.]